MLFFKYYLFFIYYFQKKTENIQPVELSSPREILTTSNTEVVEQELSNKSKSNESINKKDSNGQSSPTIRKEILSEKQATPPNTSQANSINNQTSPADIESNHNSLSSTPTQKSSKSNDKQNTVESIDPDSLIQKQVTPTNQSRRDSETTRTSSK